MWLIYVQWLILIYWILEVLQLCRLAKTYVTWDINPCTSNIGKIKILQAKLVICILSLSLSFAHFLRVVQFCHWTKYLWRNFIENYLVKSSVKEPNIFLGYIIYFFLHEVNVFTSNSLTQHISTPFLRHPLPLLLQRGLVSFWLLVFHILCAK